MTQKSRQKHENLARSLKYLLGKSPDEFGVVLDPEGWVDLKSLVIALQENRETKGVSATRIADLDWALEDSPFEIESKRIRLKPTPDFIPPLREYLPPPTLLYFGCRRKPYRVYSEKGIEPTDGREIVLARTPEMALRIGKRRDPKPILVEINTEIAANQGAHFLGYGAQLFLVDRLPKDAMFGPPVKEEDLLPPRKPKAKPKDYEELVPTAPSPDSFYSQPWDPGKDRLVLRDLSVEDEERVRRERGKKKVGWKDELRKRRRRGDEE
ncbi:MAG: RNA 2'-phosphotransferase [Candidatus Omnitrophica bacterium]|nr:RNA 2'-phosphotransferase [Candidatus Omnitrophota bacterium]